MPTKESVKSAITIILAFADTIQEASESSMLKGIPSGHLYAMVMDKMDLDAYNAIIQTLKDAKVVEEENYLLKWVGPAREVAVVVNN